MTTCGAEAGGAGLSGHVTVLNQMMELNIFYIGDSKVFSAPDSLYQHIKRLENKRSALGTEKPGFN
jgi:hypothetical protein